MIRQSKVKPKHRPSQLKPYQEDFQSKISTTPPSKKKN